MRKQDSIRDGGRLIAFLNIFDNKLQLGMFPNVRRSSDQVRITVTVR